jgi:hypothetical protein
MKFRKLRIAWSVAWGLLAVLLITLCVRSYQWRHEVFGIPYPAGTLAIVSMNGTLEFHTFPPTTNDTFGDRIDSFDHEWHGYSNVPSTIGSNGVRSSPSTRIPHGTTIIICAVVGAVPWFPKRFSLRTLLIATTLLAVVLGVAVWTAR